MLQIGEFSQICQVSVKTLHHYDKIGLLKPDFVDEYTGYRYYERVSVERLLYIKRLQSYGFSLDEIEEILSISDNSLLLERLLKQKSNLINKQRELTSALSSLSAHIRTFERTGDIMEFKNGYEIKLTDSPALNIISHREKMSVNDFSKYYGLLYERVPKERVTPDGLTGVIYHDKEFDPDSSDMELFITVKEAEKADKVLASKQCVMTSHKGAYSSLPEAYHALTGWIASNNYEIVDSPYDIYVRTMFDTKNPDEWITEIYFPVEKRG